MNMTGRSNHQRAQRYKKPAGKTCDWNITNPLVKSRSFKALMWLLSQRRVPCSRWRTDSTDRLPWTLEGADSHMWMQSRQWGAGLQLCFRYFGKNKKNTYLYSRSSRIWSPSFPMIRYCCPFSRSKLLHVFFLMKRICLFALTSAVTEGENINVSAQQQAWDASEKHILWWLTWLEMALG